MWKNLGEMEVGGSFSTFPNPSHEEVAVAYCRREYSCHAITGVLLNPSFSLISPSNISIPPSSSFFPPCNSANSREAIQFQCFTLAAGGGEIFLFSSSACVTGNTCWKRKGKVCPQQHGPKTKTEDDDDKRQGGCLVKLGFGSHNRFQQKPICSPPTKAIA